MSRKAENQKGRIPNRPYQKFGGGRCLQQASSPFLIRVLDVEPVGKNRHRHRLLNSGGCGILEI
ncbi:hypothetical protein DPMN_040378 [Dreissena polymorpha]|uniref:Uncharacterized protein n=1 Tax=Dreissena polymorpha TaxID=45954 RepID=A0A9D4CXK6_DREPO|nr:hypothetical protein DPMN_040378 [Dreissena polymorpha]